MTAAITLLDGSIGQEMVRRAGDRPTPLWSTQAMIDHPKLPAEVHLDYFEAGATVASTNTYALLPDRLALAELEDQFEALTDIAVMAARRARAAHGSGCVAGVLGPLYGSYRPDLCPPAAEAASRYGPLVARLVPQVDLLLLETMCSVDQADGALRAALGHGLPVWLAVSVMDEDGTRLRSGEPLADLQGLLAQRRPEAVLINCTRPEAVAPALEILRGFGLAFGAYANGFTRIDAKFLDVAATVDTLKARADIGPDRYAEIAMGWVDQGATIVGGCCEIGPAHIVELARRLREAGHEIV
ncbi:homocysteine S-methyltransferase family protein [Roseovarius aestuariivivens]|uniref:homocysteine S-methyltransferase family protein n=1 Tax=Roseovarius aestuariivivens TaxID=1888910 RepID=UPI002477E243|nr:homocysteine S-methyltransferase family protein [Roseovarius aestuariivivens]